MARKAGGGVSYLGLEGEKVKGHGLVVLVLRVDHWAREDSNKQLRRLTTQAV